MKQYCTSEEDIETLFTYFQAAINGEENKESLKRLFDMQCGVMRSHSYQSERDKVLDAVFASMDTFFGNIPMDSHIIQWAISKQDSFVTAAMATYLESRKLRQAGEP